MLSVKLTRIANRIVTKSPHSRAINLSVAKMGTTLPGLLPLPMALDGKLRETHGYTGTAHWVIPGRLMQGARPGFGLSSASQTETELDSQLRDLASNAKISTFVCAQAECLPEEGSILLDGDGGTRKDNPKNLPAYAHKIVDSKFLYYGIIGMKPAKSVESLFGAAHDIAKRIQDDGETVYIHCGGGVGRAGLLTACVLGVLYPTLKADQAIEYCTALCHLRNMNGEDKVYHSPETDEQQQQVRDFFRKMLDREG